MEKEILVDDSLSPVQHGRMYQTARVAGRQKGDENYVKMLRQCLIRHLSGDWGAFGSLKETSVSKEEVARGMFATDDTAKLNRISLIKNHGSILSEYEVLNGKFPERIWICTELNKYTIILFPSEY